MSSIDETRSGLATLGVALAMAANTAVYLHGNRGAPIQVITGRDPDGVDPEVLDVVAVTSIAVAAGAALLWAVLRWRPDGFRTWVILAGAFAVASALPLLRLGIDAGSKAALVSMHLLTGVAVIAAQSVVRRP